MAEIKPGDRIVWARTEEAIQAVLRQFAAMTAKNVRRKAELARTERIIRQRRDISA